jgi:xanthine dehydrogenase accessory factor
MKQFWFSLADQLEAGRAVFIALVVDHTAGSPGTRGARLWLSESGEQFGTIGGGVMEYQLLETAEAVLRTKEFIPVVKTLHHHTTNTGEESGLICAGQQTNLYYLCHSAQDRAIVQQIREHLTREMPASLTIQTTGLRLEAGLPNLHQSPIQLVYDGEDWLYQEHLFNRRRIAILGGGHCALALAQIMQGLGYEVLVFETRPAIATLTTFPAGVQVKLVPDFQTAGSAIPFPELTCVAVLTTSFRSDIEALLGVLGRPFPFVGVMGSRSKLARIFDELRQAQIQEEQLAALYAPIGLPMDSHTPAEIAVSIAAQILQTRTRQQFLNEELILFR